MDLVARAKNILLTPKAEWAVIASETTSTASLYTGYIMPLAAIGAVAIVIGLGVLGAPTAGVIVGVVGYLLHLAGVYLLGLFYSKIAPSFDGRDDMGQGLKLAAYSMTPIWVASVLLIIPALGILIWLAALYGIVLLYLGAGQTLAIPQAKLTVYTLIAVIGMVVMLVVIRLIVRMLTGA